MTTIVVPVLPPIVYVADTGVVHDPANVRACFPAPIRESGLFAPHTLHHARKWCGKCWTGKRCTVFTGCGMACGRPSGGHVECSEHLASSIAEDKAFERRAS